MNQCFGCNTCKSADKPLEDFIRTLPNETSHHRVAGQSVKCGFGLQGVCCRLCSNGPCRVTPKAPKGICGATADVIVARNFLRAVAAGSGCFPAALPQQQPGNLPVKQRAHQKQSHIPGISISKKHERGPGQKQAGPPVSAQPVKSKVAGQGQRKKHK